MFRQRGIGPWPLNNDYHFHDLIMVLISLHYALTRLADDFCLITLSLFNLFCPRLLHPHQQFHHTKDELRETFEQHLNPRKPQGAIPLKAILGWAFGLLYCAIVITGTVLKHLVTRGDTK